MQRWVDWFAIETRLSSSPAAIAVVEGTGDAFDMGALSASLLSEEREKIG